MTSKRQQLIDSEILHYVKQAESQELEKEMRAEGVEALKIAARKMAYKKKYYDSEKDKISVFPSVRHCLLGHDVYDEAEKHYYDDGDDYPLKYIAALREVAFERHGDDDDDNDDSEDAHKNNMGTDIDSDDELFDELLQANETDMEKELCAWIQKAEREELDKEMRPEAVTALKRAIVNVGESYASLAECLLGNEIYEEAERFYFEPEDDFPLKYTSALRALALAALAEDDGAPPQDTPTNNETVEEDAPDSNQDPKENTTKTNESRRKELIDQVIDKFVKQAEEEELEKEMRQEGVKALKIAAYKMAYRKKYYDMANDKIVIFPSVTKLLAGIEIYEEAEKYYYEDGDDYPLKYIAALRGIALVSGGAPDEEDEKMESMGTDIEANDEVFATGDSFEP